MNVTETQDARPRFLFVHSVAHRLNVSRRTVRWWARSGRLRARRRGLKLWAFDVADVEAFAALRRFRGEAP